MASPPRRRLSLAERQQLAREQMEIESYSVSELKRALDMRGIDHRDALEKAELLQRLRQDMSDEENMGVIAQSRTDELLPSERSVVALFERCSPSVAFIQTTEAVQVKGDQQLSLNATEERPAGTGTGFVWDEQGHVVTNFHVIKDAINRGRAMVTLTGGTETHAATLVGMEPDKDVAVLKVDAPPEDLKPISVGSSADLLVGQTVIAIGNPFGLDSTLTTGVVSALGREVMGVNDRPISGCIQTDASINPGNSGGPLLDSSGRLIGVNTAIFSPSGTSAGIGFAIPVDTVRRIVNQIIRHGRVSAAPAPFPRPKSQPCDLSAGSRRLALALADHGDVFSSQVQRASLGVQIAEDGVMAQIAQRVAARGGKIPQGVLVMGVNPGSPAEGAGIRPTTRVRSLALLLFLPLHFASRHLRCNLRTCAHVQVCSCARVLACARTRAAAW